MKQPGQGPNADLIMKAFAAVARKDGFASQLEGLELLPQVLQGSGRLAGLCDGVQDPGCRDKDRWLKDQCPVGMELSLDARRLSCLPDATAELGPLNLRVFLRWPVLPCGLLAAGQAYVRSYSGAVTFLGAWTPVVLCRPGVSPLLPSTKHITLALCTQRWPYVVE